MLGEVRRGHGRGEVERVEREVIGGEVYRRYLRPRCGTDGGRRRLMFPVFARSERGDETFGKSRLGVGQAFSLTWPYISGLTKVTVKFKDPSVVGIAAFKLTEHECGSFQYWLDLPCRVFFSH